MCFGQIQQSIGQSLSSSSSLSHTQYYCGVDILNLTGSVKKQKNILGNLRRFEQTTITIVYKTRLVIVRHCDVYYFHLSLTKVQNGKCDQTDNITDILLSIYIGHVGIVTVDSISVIRHR